ncbi:MAG: SDR family NAD(P)-dependent oxidoreductase, partial [Gaiellales bacterium]
MDPNADPSPAPSPNGAPVPAGSRTALVTGSARRVGRMIATALIADGWQVLIHARETERAREACEELGAAGFVGADLASAEGIAELAAAVRTTLCQQGGLNLLVNSASSFERVAHWSDA